MGRKETTNDCLSGHSMPKCLVGLLQDLRTHESIAHVGAGEFHFNAGERGSKIEVKGIDQASRTVKFVAYHEGAAQKYFITIKKGREHVVEVGKFLDTYQF